MKKPLRMITFAGIGVAFLVVIVLEVSGPYRGAKIEHTVTVPGAADKLEEVLRQKNVRYVRTRNIHGEPTIQVDTLSPKDFERATASYQK
jgi:hypothetical protein